MQLLGECLDLQRGRALLRAEHSAASRMTGPAGLEGWLAVRVADGRPVVAAMLVASEGSAPFPER